jgi:carbamoyl-phosphate synthase large subunit
MKALTIASLPVEIYPVDVQVGSAGLYRGQVGTLLPKPESAGALEQWQVWLKQNAIQAIIPGSDHDLLPLSLAKDSWREADGVQVLVSDSDLIRICRDKALTIQHLRRLGLPCPESIWDVSLNEASQWAKAKGYPVILKPRLGSASRGLQLVQDDDELRFFFPRTDSPIVQEYLHRAGEILEFTCAAFADGQGQVIGTFMARRDLAAGSTYRAEVNFWPEINELLLNIAQALKPFGPINVQLRLTQRGPVPFEINLRCSGTTSIRAHFGYNEPEMLLRHYVLGEPLVAPQVNYGYAFRYWNEVFLDGVTEARLRAGPAGLAGVVRAWP